MRSRRRSCRATGRRRRKRSSPPWRRRRSRLITADYQRAAVDAGSVISASLFGALAAADVLPFPRESFADVIKASGRGVDASQRAFEAGAEGDIPSAEEPTRREAGPRGPARLMARWTALEARLEGLPAPVREMAATGLRHVVDFQDPAYGRGVPRPPRARRGGGRRRLRVLHRRGQVHRHRHGLRRRNPGGGSQDPALKVRPGAAGDGVGCRRCCPYHRVHAPAGGRALRRDAGVARRLDRGAAEARPLDRPPRQQGAQGADRWRLLVWCALPSRRGEALAARHAAATGSRRRTWSAGSLSRWRRRSGDRALAAEIVACRRLIKGYSDTHARGEAKFDKVLAALPMLEGRADAADWLRRLRDAALRDEKGRSAGWARSRRWPRLRRSKQPD